MTDYDVRIANILAEFGLTNYGSPLPLQREATELVRAEDDMFGREQYMAPQTQTRWHQMKVAAKADDIELLLVSAWRSVDYQHKLIQRKLDNGLLIEDILKVNALPGYSEHHTGCALDLATPGVEPLTEAFETTPAFEWLMENASTFDFSLSYPRDNPYGIIYEPWHWANIRR